VPRAWHGVGVALLHAVTGLAAGLGVLGAVEVARRLWRGGRS
jgi:hypothetical protein